MKLQHALVASALFLASSSAMSANYGMAGCGLGSIAAKSMAWDDNIMQVLVATTNGTSASQTFGITTGSSNCAEGGSASETPVKKAKKKTAQQVYLQYNLAHIKADSAKGEGDYIEGLAGLFGCQNQLTGSYSEFATVSQNHLSEIFSSENSEVVGQNYVNAMEASKLACNNG